MSRLPLSTELGLVAFVLVFPLWSISPMENPMTTVVLLVAQLTACIGSFVARRKERIAWRAEYQALIDRIKKKRNG